MKEKLEKLNHINIKQIDLLIEIANLCGRKVMPTEQELNTLRNKIIKAIKQQQKFITNKTKMKEEKEEPQNNGAEAITFILSLAAVGYMLYVFLK